MKGRILVLTCFQFFCFLAVSAQTYWSVSKESEIEVSGTSTLHDWTVKANNIRGTIVVKELSGIKSKAAGQEIAAATLTISVGEIKGDRGPVMDNKMYKALKKDRFQEIEFVMDCPVEFENEGTGPFELKLTGTISISGVKRNIAIELQGVQRGKNVFHFTGTTAMKMSDFDVEPPTAMFGQIVTHDEIKCGFNLVFKK